MIFNYPFSKNTISLKNWVPKIKKHTSFIVLPPLNFNSCRKYSTTVPVYSIFFNNADKDKINILKEVKNKSGIYMWTNNINNKKYIGSSVNINRRLLEYFNVNRLQKEKSMPINLALLKYGYSSFSFTVLVYCDKNLLMEKEKYYFDQISPEYNILKIPGSPSRVSGWKHSALTVEKMRKAALNLSSKRSNENLSKGNPYGYNVKITNIITNEVNTYNAIISAARSLGVSTSLINNYLHINNGNPLLALSPFKGKRSDHFLQLRWRKGLGKYVIELLNKDYKPNTQKNSKGIKVTDVDTGSVITYTSIGEAARELKIYQASISL